MIDESYMNITKYDVLGKLPDPFLLDEGRRVADRADWDLRRREIYRTAIELQYGTMPNFSNWSCSTAARRPRPTASPPAAVRIRSTS